MPAVSSLKIVVMKRKTNRLAKAFPAASFVLPRHVQGYCTRPAAGTTEQACL